MRYCFFIFVLYKYFLNTTSLIFNFFNGNHIIKQVSVTFLFCNHKIRELPKTSIVIVPVFLGKSYVKSNILDHI